MIRLWLLRTPDTLDFGSNVSQEHISYVLNQLFAEHDSWSEQCSEILLQNPVILFLYLEFVVGNAFGSHEFKIVLNPFLSTVFI